MKIQKITSQNRRDFCAVYECEHCGSTKKGSGYDDAYFHKVVIPKMKCSECDKIAGDDFRPMATKYPDNVTV